MQKFQLYYSTESQHANHYTAEAAGRCSGCVYIMGILNLDSQIPYKINVLEGAQATLYYRVFDVMQTRTGKSVLGKWVIEKFIFRYIVLPIVQISIMNIHCLG